MRCWSTDGFPLKALVKMAPGSWQDPVKIPARFSTGNGFSRQPKSHWDRSENLAVILDGKRISWRPKSPRNPGENLAAILETKCGACSFVMPTVMYKDLIAKPNQSQINFRKSQMSAWVDSPLVWICAHTHAVTNMTSRLLLFRTREGNEIREVGYRRTEIASCWILKRKFLWITWAGLTLWPFYLHVTAT